MTEPSAAPPSPDTIRRLMGAVHHPFAFMAAMQLDLWTPLAAGPLTGEDLARALGVSAGKLTPLLYLLTAAGLLTVADERFANTAEADHYLVRGRPDFRGDEHRLFYPIWQAELQSAATVRTGKAQARIDFDALTPQAVADFFGGGYASTYAEGQLLGQHYDLSACRTLVDVGGGSGAVALALTAAYPQLRATVADLSAVTAATRRFVADAGATDRVRVVEADCVRGPIPGAYDAAVLKAFLQTLDVGAARRALRQVHAALRPGGTIYILGAILDDTRLSPPGAVNFNLILINIYDGGLAYTEGEHRAWLAEAGFTAIVRDHLPNGAVVMVARKPS